MFAPPADLIDLPSISTATVLHTLRLRHGADQIYTAIGPVISERNRLAAITPQTFAARTMCFNPLLTPYCLAWAVAMNPFRKTAESSPERIQELLRVPAEELPPHIFNVARSAYSVMCATGGAQSILISGESGAGKTESAKLCLACLAKLSSSPAAVTATALESGLLLESFGNARTVYNDNSSRFGKFLEVRFDKRDCIAACHIRSYLLEISRVVRQGS